MITASDLKLTGHRVFESTDFDDTKARISAIMQPHELIPVGRAQNLHAYMSFVDLFGFGVGTIKFGHMRVRLEHVEDYLLMIFCPAGSGKVYSGRDEVP